MEGDRRLRRFLQNVPYFNPLPPYGGRPLPYSELITEVYFNPLPPYGGRHTVGLASGIVIFISIHSLRMEGDGLFSVRTISERYFNPLPPYGGRRCRIARTCSQAAFQSTPSVWRETCDGPPVRKNSHISIHSLRMEGDMDGKTSLVTHRLFQSTPSVWRETHFVRTVKLF